MIFREELAVAILRGKKTATRRRFSDNPRSPWYEGRCAYKVGQVFAVQPGRGKPRIGDARVTAVYVQPLGHMTEEDALKEGFRSSRAGRSALLNFDSAWEEINGDYFPDEAVWVIEFELLEHDALNRGAKG